MEIRRGYGKNVISRVFSKGGKVVVASLLALSIGNVYAADSSGTNDYTLSNTSDVLPPNSSQSDLYTYIKVDAKGPDTVTKFEYNSENQTFVPVFYRMELKNKTYGNGNLQKSYGFTKDADGNVKLGEGSTYTIKYEDVSSKTYTNTYQDKTKNSEVTLTDFEGSDEYSLNGIYSDADFIDGKIENALFKNNLTNAELNISKFYDLYQSGGVLSVVNDMESITADFIGNSIKLSAPNFGYTYAKGGAIYNEANIGSINGYFKDNTVNILDWGNDYGGAIYNSGKIDSINATFEHNNAGNNGGAIANDAPRYNTFNVIRHINGDFINNSAGSSGGAIYNSDYSAIGDITANFVGNSSGRLGGAIYNGGSGRRDGSIANINGDFIVNSAGYSGGAIYNTGNMSVAYSNVDNPQKIYDFTNTYYDIYLVDEYGNIIDSYSYYRSDKSYIDELNKKISEGYKINVIEENLEFSYTDRDDFESNREYIEKYYTYDNPLANLSDDDRAIERPISINSNFIGNYATGNYGAFGGAIANKKAMSVINGDFIKNYTEAGTLDYNTSLGAQGGAIYNTAVDDAGLNGKGSIPKINGNFIGNYAVSTGDPEPGGMVSNAHPDYNIAQGGAIYNSSIIGDIVGDFIGNYVKSKSGNAAGGAIYNTYNLKIKGNISNIDGNFISNKAEGVSVKGGALLNSGAVINELNGNFYLNEAKAVSENAFGGAILNGLYTDISSSYSSPITIISSDMNIKGDFVQNSVYGIKNANGGAIYNAEYANWGQYGVAYSTANINVSGNFYGNKAVAEDGNAYGGAVYNHGDISFFNTSLINNFAEAGKNGEAKGGGIYSDKSFTFAADGGNSLIQGNYLKDKDGNIKNNAIYMGNYISYEGKGDGATVVTKNDNTVLTLASTNNGKFIINDKISGIGALVSKYVTNKDGSKRYVEVIYEGNQRKIVDTDAPTEVTNYGVIFTGDGTGEIQLNNNIEAEDFVYDDGRIEKGRADVTLDGAHLHLATRADVLDGNNISFTSGIFNMINNSVGVPKFNEFQIDGDTEFLADVDLKNKQMDRITADNYLPNSGNIIVSGMNLLNDAPEGQDVTEIYFAPKEFKDNVISGTSEAPTAGQTTYYTPIYRYDVSYDNRENDGYFIFTRGGANTGNNTDNYNPSVLLTPTANLAAGQAAMNEAFKYVFEHADAFTQLPQNERFARINQNHYAINSDFSGTYSPINNELQNQGLWIRPYTTFETMNLKNGPKVDAITYGTLIGFDSEFREMKNGWHNVFTGYLGYNGSQLDYSGVDSSMNGGLIGFTETFYKGNFWTAVTASAGAALSEAHTMYGKENMTSLLAGIGSKTGYNFEFKDGKFIIQPIMFLSYTFVNTFDYTNAAGVKIDSDPMHSIQLNPSVRFIANCKNGWQPYASVGMVWNLMNETSAKANNVKLPEMSIKPYVEYGVGVQRMWDDKYTAFLQGMVRNGGRNGIALTAGFRWTFGKKNEETVYVPKTKTVIKKLKKPMRTESRLADKL